MCVEPQTKKLAQTVFLFFACSLCAIFLCMAATNRHNIVASQAANFTFYTYQNPFTTANNASSAVLSEPKPGGTLAKLASVKWCLGLSGLAALWLASTWYLQGEWSAKKRVHREVSYTDMNYPAKMNRLAVLPTRVMRVTKWDTFNSPVSSTVVCQTTTRCLLAHKRTTAPCQSRFRPITLASSRTRFERL